VISAHFHIMSLRRSKRRNIKKPGRYESPVTSPNANNDSLPPAASPSSSNIAANAAQRQQPQSEATTIVPSQDDNDILSVASEEPISTESPPSLAERVPNATDVIKVVRELPSIRIYFTNSRYHQKKEDVELFFDSEEAGYLWQEVCFKLTSAISKCTPTVEKEIKSRTNKFEKLKDKILLFISDFDLVEEEDKVDGKKLKEMITIQEVIGAAFVYWFQGLIKPLHGDEVVPIHQQISSALEDIIQKDVDKLFDDNTSRHVYYIIGFLCHAGSKEAERRSDDNASGKCIKALEEHFASGRDDTKLNEIKEELPDDITSLVDRRCSWGGLKYPDLQLYTCFAVMESIYSNLATVDNFTKFGGTLLITICQGMLKNERLISLFTELYVVEGEKLFPDDVIVESMAYYIKVFGNVRAKDLCYRLNSNILKGATVGVRQTLAATKGKGTKKKKKGKGKKQQQKTKKRRKKTQQEEEEEEEAAEEVDDTSEEEEELPSTDASKHESLLALAEEDMEDNEDYDKHCTVEEGEEDAYMGKTEQLDK